MQGETLNVIHCMTVMRETFLSIFAALSRLVHTQPILTLALRQKDKQLLRFFSLYHFSSVIYVICRVIFGLDNHYLFSNYGFITANCLKHFSKRFLKIFLLIPSQSTIFRSICANSVCMSVYICVDKCNAFVLPQHRELVSE